MRHALDRDAAHRDARRPVAPAPADPRRVRGPRHPRPAPRRRPPRPPAPHLDRPAPRLRIRRERTADGWCLHFTGRDAHGELIDRVFDEIEMLLGPRSSRVRGRSSPPPLTGATAGALILRGETARMDLRATLTELCDAFNAHDLDRIMACFADDCVLEMPRGSQPWGTRCEGKPTVRAALATRFEGLPDVHYGDAEHFVDRPPTPASRNGPSPAPAAPGREKEVRGCDFYTFRDGKVIRKDFVLEDRGARGPDAIAGKLCHRT